MTATAILLVGGRGTRLGPLTDQTPKPLLAVASRPFIFHVLDHLISQGITDVILATGYLAARFEEVVGSGYRTLSIRMSGEDAPLGTGGAIARAFRTFEPARAYVLNGDTLFKADLRALEQVHESCHAALSLVLRRVDDASRYGQIACQGDRVVAMREKGAQGPGWINGGIYLIEREQLLANTPPDAFSLERDLLPPLIAKGIVAGLRSSAYFIDIGVPDDLLRAQSELRP